MIDIGKQIAYWQTGAAEGWEIAQELINGRRVRHGLFFAHLTLEKILKAHVCCHIHDLAPRIHNLVRLADLAALSLNVSQVDLLAEMNAFNIEGRYPDLLMPPPSLDEAEDYLRRTEEVYQWLMNQLPG
ncbi:MAG: HEPN domain-containing protein [Anaerolineae bacterium]|nr:HEPN domain-containing protein [Anaerolineae bacterium]